MHSRPISAQTSPLNEDQAGQLNRLVETLTPDQANWVSGYLAGLNAARYGEQPQPAAAATADAPVLTILYGSETGNAEGIAHQAAGLAGTMGLKARVFDMADYKPRELRDEKLLMIVTATHGEGDPPDPAEAFHEFLHSRKAPKLPGVRFAVLGLGDSSYEHFCQTGKDFDARLAALGAERLCERVDCDVDYDEPAAQWIEAALGAFSAHAAPAQTAANVVSFSGSVTAGAQGYDRRNPFPAEVLENLTLTGRGSNKETRHIELSLEGSGLGYEPGDALSIVVENRPDIVDDLINALGFEAGDSVKVADHDVPLAEALRRHFEITTLTPPFLNAYAGYAKSDRLNDLLDPASSGRLTEYRWGRHVIDVVEEFPADGIGVQAFVDTLRKLQPREYSIASSFNANPGEVHITVAVVRYHSHGRDRYGVGSTHLAERAEAGASVPVYVTRNKNFKLPQDPDTPIIMIGPGTGVAPFRAFVEEREYQEAGGRNWLFFGEQHFRTDFLYQTEWQRWLRDGVLTRIDVAFSRDTADKIYVQHRMREKARDLYAWLEEGAVLYVCGDAERMAPDVHAALHEIVASEGGVSQERAAEYVKTLQREKRYLRDVY